MNGKYSEKETIKQRTCALIRYAGIIASKTRIR